jgi:hypothetical protein
MTNELRDKYGDWINKVADRAHEIATELMPEKYEIGEAIQFRSDVALHLCIIRALSEIPQP